MREEPSGGTQPNWRGRTSHGRYIGCAAVLCVLITIPTLVSRMYQNNRLKNMTKEAAVKWWPRLTLTTTTAPEEPEVVGWGRNVSRDAAAYIQPFNDTTIIPGKEICGHSNNTLVIIVTTSPSQYSERALIRQTWASRKVKGVRIGFFVGFTTNRSVQISLEQESEIFRDIIQENILDSYNNLTLKSITLLKWYVRNCRNSTFLMKSDADTFVNVKLLVRYLANCSANGTLTGYVCPACGVIRTDDPKWSVPKYMYPNQTYPDFLFGYAYVMSRDVAEKLYAAALRTPIFFLEDVYITGLCAQEAGVIPQPFEGSSTYVWNVQKVCKETHSMCHPIKPDEMRQLWNTRKVENPII